MGEVSFHVVSSPIERSVWQRTEISCQWSVRNHGLQSTAMWVSILGANPTTLFKPSANCTMADVLTAISRGILKQNHPDKMVPDPWPSMSKLKERQPSYLKQTRESLRLFSWSGLANLGSWFWNAFQSLPVILTCLTVVKCVYSRVLNTLVQPLSWRMIQQMIQ